MTENSATVLSDAMVATRRAFRWVAFFSLGINLLMLTIPLYMMQVFDRVLAGRSEATLFYLTVLALGALLTFGLLELVRFRIVLRVNGWLERRLAPEAFSRAVTAALLGRAYRTEALRDLGQLRSLLGSAAVFALCDAPWVPVYVVVVYLLHPLVGTVVLVGAILLFGLALVNELVTRAPLRAANEAALAAMRRAEAMARNAEVIDAMGMMPGVVARWRGANQQVLVQQTVAAERAGLILALSKFGRLAVQIGVVGAGAWLAIHQDLTAGALIAGSIMTSRALAPVEQAIGTWKQVVGARSAYARLKRLFVETPLPAAVMALPAPEGHLSVERASFVYPGNAHPIVKGISFHVPAGEALAIVGPSAAGKSTLARLLIGVWAPAAGSVRLDGADVHAWDRTDFGRHVGYLPQDVELFDGTVRDNIARFGEAPAETIVEAARMADVHDMILRLPQGYETEVGDGGAVLSGGQRQRVALARALLGEPRLLVLDEPNSNLDGEGEEALSRAIAASKAAGGTVVIIAHRPAVLAHVDKVLVLRDGQVEAFGARNEILRVLTRPRAVAGEGRQAADAAIMPRQEARR